MNKTNYSIVSNMQKSEFIAFLKNALGLFHFLDNKGMKLVGGMNSKPREDNFYAFAKLLDSKGNRVNTYYIRKGKRIELEFLDDHNELYYVDEFFDRIFDDSILFCLLIASKKQKTPFVFDEIVNENHQIDRVSMRKMLDMEVETISFFEKKDLKRYYFILGAGINSKLGPGSWDELINDMQKSILRLTSLNVTDLNDFKDKICNTTYVIPQILKDLNEKEYFDILNQNIYGNFIKGNLSIKLNPQFEDTTIYQVARILVSNKDENKALTFNYDELLEMVLNDNFGVNPTVIFKGCATTKDFLKIYHSHGFWPYTETKTKIHKNSIVLSSIEYMENYQTLQDYSAKTLNSFIDNTCILVGNSLCDYEEQKIFKGHYKKNMAQYSFLFMRENDVWKRKYYLIYFLQMGVIPIFFTEFDEMVSYLKKL